MQIANLEIRGVLGSTTGSNVGGGGKSDSNIDTNPPVIIMPSDKTFEATAVLTPLGTSDYGMATATDDQGTAIVSNNATSAFLLGSTTITWTATDEAGNTATAHQIITVQDTTKPVLTLPINATIEATAILTPLDSSDYGTATATDIFVPVTITNNATASFSLGDTTITWKATDANKNNATAHQVITIQDTTPPTFLTSGDIVVVTALQSEPVLYDMSVMDAVDSDPAVICFPGPGSVFGVGSTAVRCTATDDSGNTSYMFFNVVLQNPLHIHDTFDSLGSWAEFNEKSARHSDSFARYAASIQDVGSDNILHISGDGFVSNSGIKQTFDVSSAASEPLYLSFDWRAKSDFSGSCVTNAGVAIENSTNTLYSERLVCGGTYDTSWRQYSKDISSVISGNQDITVKLYLNDSWIANWNQKAWFDDFVLSTQSPLPASSAASSAPQHTWEMLVSEMILDGTIHKYYEDASLKEQKQISEMLIMHNATMP
jgi:hypothetical protein